MLVADRLRRDLDRVVGVRRRPGLTCEMMRGSARPGVDAETAGGSSRRAGSPATLVTPYMVVGRWMVSWGCDRAGWWVEGADRARTKTAHWFWRAPRAPGRRRPCDVPRHLRASRRPPRAGRRGGRSLHVVAPHRLLDVPLVGVSTKSNGRGRRFPWADTMSLAMTAGRRSARGGRGPARADLPSAPVTRIVRSEVGIAAPILWGWRRGNKGGARAVSSPESILPLA